MNSVLVVFAGNLFALSHRATLSISLFNILSSSLTLSEVTVTFCLW